RPSDVLHAAALLHIIEVIQRAGHGVCVLTQAREDVPEPPLQGLDVVWFPWFRRGSRLAELSFSSPANLLSAASLIVQGTRHVRRMRKTRKIDVFVCGWVIPSGFYVYLDRVLQRSRVPYVLWALGSDVNKYKHNPIMRHALKRIAAGAGHRYA